MNAERGKGRSVRRTTILGAVEDGEWRDSGISGWADVPIRQARADLKWLEEGEFVVQETDQYGDRHWAITIKGKRYLAGLSDKEKPW